MGEVAQSIIVTIILVLAIAWTVKRLFFTQGKSCGCGKEDCGAPHSKKNCAGCPLEGKCKG